MDRRAFLTRGASAAALALVGHSPSFADLEPDAKWAIYRRYRLLVVGQRDDELASGVAAAVANVLERFLPTSRARVAAAADTRRVGVLIGTGQQDVAVMAAASADALFFSRQPFEDLRGVPLRLIVSFGSHALVCRSDFAAHHAYLLAQTLYAHADQLPRPAGAPTGPVPSHPGSHAFFSGFEMHEAPRLRQVGNPVSQW
jgi:hypothetical protein